MCIQKPKQCERTHAHTYQHTFIHTRIYPHTYRQTFIHNHVHIHVHTWANVHVHTHPRAYAHHYSAYHPVDRRLLLLQAIWYGTHADQLVLSSSRSEMLSELEVHRTPSGHVCDTDIENMIVTLRHERHKNAALMAALKEMEKQQVASRATTTYLVPWTVPTVSSRSSRTVNPGQSHRKML